MARGLGLLGVLASATALQGCMVGWRAANVELGGTMHDGEELPGLNLVEWDDARRHFQSGLAFTPLGEATVHGRPVDLPRLQALRRMGLVVVDVEPLPAPWRPPVSAVTSSTLVVSALDRASPLAHAGLRVGDALERIAHHDEVVASVGSGAVGSGLAALEEARVDRWRDVTLTVRKPDGSTLELEVALDDELHDVTAWTLPGIMNYAGSTTGTGLTIGPVGTIFAARGAVLTDDQRFVERAEWGLLFDLLFFQSETDLETGERLSRFRFFYVFELGDDKYDVRKA